MTSRSARARRALSGCLLGVSLACTPQSPPTASPPASASGGGNVPGNTGAVSSAEVGTSSRDAATAPSAAPRQRRLDERALARLVEDARTSESDALVIVKDGKLVGKWLFGKREGPIQSMSITKSVIGLAVGTLVDSGKLRLDQPIASLYPEWAKDERRAITVEHLLTHSSGIEEGKSTLPIYASRDFVRLTLSSKLEHPPGTHYEYGNRATNLLSGLIAKVSKMPTDRYVAQVLLEPMGIERFEWSRDRAGQAQGMAGLHLLPSDLAKLGELVLAEGRFAGRQLVSAKWVRASTATPARVQPDSRRLGRLWWLVPEWTERRVDDDIVQGWREAGVDEAFVEKFSALRGRSFASLAGFFAELQRGFGPSALEEWSSTLWKQGIPDVRYRFGPIVGCYAAGTLGQYLVVLPRDSLVAVRMRRMPKGGKGRDDPDKTFPDFVERVQGLVGD